MRLLFTLFSVVAVCVAQIETTEAAVINYGNFAGSSVSFNGVSENPNFNPTLTTGLYGTPSVMNNMLIFSPLEFEAAVSGVGSQIRNSTLSSIVAAQSGFLITGYSVERFGDYALTVPFSPAGQAQVGVSVSDANFSTSFNSIANTQPGFAAAFGPTVSVVAIAPTASLTLSLLTTLNASTTSPFNDAFIKLKGFKVTVDTQAANGVIPEPSSALIFLGLGLVGLSSRRRR